MATKQDKAEAGLRAGGGTAVKPTGLALLREPFADHQVSKLPKATCKQEDYRNLTKGTCTVCGGYHATTRTIHLDYVGHAAVTDRLLSADPNWSWEPLTFAADGTPMVDKDGGFWIKLTVCGMTRLGYGDAGGKTGNNAMKERIGDAIRNAAMRFGVALDLWHKGELHKEELDAGQADEADRSGGVATFNPRKKQDEKVDKDTGEIPAPAGAEAEPEQPATQPEGKAEKPAKQKAEPAKGTAAPAGEPITEGEAAFLRKKAGAAGKGTEAELCKQFGVNGDSFNGATKDQWTVVKSFVMGK